MALGWKRQTPPWVRCVSWGLSCSATTHTLDSGDYGATRVVRHLQGWGCLEYARIRRARVDSLPSMCGAMEQCLVRCQRPCWLACS